MSLKQFQRVWSSFTIDLHPPNSSTVCLMKLLLSCYFIIPIWNFTIIVHFTPPLPYCQMLLWPMVHIIVLVTAIESNLQNLHPDLPMTSRSPLAGPQYLYASASSAIKLLFSLRFVAENNRMELCNNSAYKVFKCAVTSLSDWIHAEINYIRYS